MITQDMAKMIYNCMAEIKQSEQFLESVKKDLTGERFAHEYEFLRDRDSGDGYYTLGYSIGSSSKRIAGVAPELTIAIINEHIKKLNKTLAELNRQAAQQLTTPHKQGE